MRVDEVAEGAREFSLFVAGNFDELHRPHDALPKDSVVEPEARGHVAPTRHAARLVRTTSAPRALEEVLAAAGATLPEGDAVDARLVREVTAVPAS